MFDYENQFAYEQSVNGNAVVSQNVVFLGKGDPGSGTPKAIEIDVAGGATAPLTVTVQTSPISGGTFTDKATATATADEVAEGGAVLGFFLPTGLADYVRLAFSGNATVTASLVPAAQTNTRTRFVDVGF